MFYYANTPLKVMLIIIEVLLKLASNYPLLKTQTKPLVDILIEKCIKYIDLVEDE